MTKKDYQMMAWIINEAGKDGREPIKFIRESCASWFSKDNERFDYDRFMEACTTGKCKGMKAR
jgi:hypothetical protein